MYCLLHLCFQSGIELLFFIFEGGTICITKWICMNFFSISLWCGGTSFSFDLIFMFELWYSMKNSIITPIRMRRNSTVEKIVRGNFLNFIFSDVWRAWLEQFYTKWSHFEIFLIEKKENWFRGVLPSKKFPAVWVSGWVFVSSYLGSNIS